MEDRKARAKAKLASMSQEERDVIKISKMLAEKTPPEVLVISLMSLLDKVMHGPDGSKGSKERREVAQAALTLVTEMMRGAARQLRKDTEQEKNEERASEFAQATIARAMKASEQMFDLDLNEVKGVIMPGNDSVN